MKTYIYTFEDTSIGIPLFIEAEVHEYTAIDEPPYIVIQDIAHGETTIEQWCLSDALMTHLKNKVFQIWAKEA